jgi:hypothetical protein
MQPSHSCSQRAPLRRGRARPRQRDRLFALLKARANLWVPLKDVLALGIAQYGSRIFELRRLGHRIESKQEGDRSWFRLVPALASVAIPESESIKEPSTKPDSLFGQLAPPRHLDLG